MEARQIRKLRKQIESKGYYEKRLQQSVDSVDRWHTFETFQCNSNFRGYELSRHNQEVYNKNYPKAIARLNWYRIKCGYNEPIM